MREEHPDQQELPELPPGGPVPPPEGSADLAEMSEVAKLQAEVLPLGLVREARPVFVYDAKLAREKKGNAARQARLREKRAAQGLVTAQIPREIAEAVKAAGGDWSKLKQADVGTVGGQAPQTPSAPGWVGQIEAAGGPEAWLALEVSKALAARPPEVKEVIKEVVREVPKPTLKLNDSQRQALKVGLRVQSLRGWRASMARWLLGM